jgi:hypothetical protein
MKLDVAQLTGGAPKCAVSCVLLPSPLSPALSSPPKNTILGGCKNMFFWCKIGGKMVFYPLFLNAFFFFHTSPRSSCCQHVWGLSRSSRVLVSRQFLVGLETASRRSSFPLGIESPAPAFSIKQVRGAKASGAATSLNQCNRKKLGFAARK